MSHTRLHPSFTFTEERLAELRAVAPEAFADGRVNWEALREALGEWTEHEGADAEHFGLFWPGKREARRLAAKPSRGTLVPVPGEGVNEETTRNLFIEGDNLEVLKLLQKSYAGRVKMIYIDPPYNTGNDFVYKDDFRDPLGDYLRKTGQANEAGAAVTTNTRSDGRFHSNWLSMMYPRLRLARALLRDDGFVAVSIDDTELATLRMLMNEVFGEENLLATLVWDRNRKNDARFFSVGHEYMVIYAKEKQHLIANEVVLRAPKEGVEEVRSEWERLRHRHRDDWAKVQAGLKAFFAAMSDDDPRKPLARFGKVDERGPYRDDGNPSWPGGGGPRYEVRHPVTGRPCKLPKRGWVYSTKERMDEAITQGVVVFGPDESTIPSIRTNLFERTEQVMRSVQYSYAQTSSQQFDALFDGLRVFDNPKPVSDIARLVEYLSDPGDLVLDFFAGSGTTGHAVFDVACRTGGARPFICVQLPEAVSEKELSGRNAISIGLETIADITKDRLRRSIKKLAEAKQCALPKALGFRVLRLEPSNFRAWQDYDGENLEQLEALFEEAETPLVKGWTPDALLTEVLLLQGFPLDARIEPQAALRKNDIRLVTSDDVSHRLWVCLDRKIHESTVAAMTPTAEDVVVCLDSALDDEAKLRLADRCTLETI